jgi:hypothetical protein
MKRETIFLGFFSLLLALGFDAICSDAHAGIIIWLACIALWGVFTTLTLSERLENVTEFNRRILKQLREKEEKGK